MAIRSVKRSLYNACKTGTLLHLFLYEIQIFYINKFYTLFQITYYFLCCKQKKDEKNFQAILFPTSLLKTLNHESLQMPETTVRLLHHSV